MDKKQLLLLFMIVLLFSLNLGIRASSHEELRVVMHQQQEAIAKIEIVVPDEIEEMIAEVYNFDSEMTHYLLLKDPIQKRQRKNYLNSFYITGQMVDFKNMYNIIIYPQNNEGVSYTPTDMEVQQELKFSVELSEGSETPMKIMSYNIHHGKSLTGRHTLDEMVQLMKASGAEIIGLQEVDSSMPRSRMQNQVRYLGEALQMNYVYGENINILGGRYGNAVLSKYPIEFSENLFLPSNREQRGLLNAVINVNGRRINFMVTHLGLNDEERQSQLRSIQNYMGTVAGDVILVGDFNMSPQDPALMELKRKMVDVAWALGENNTPTFDFPFLSKRIDYIFVPPSFELIDYQVIKSRASDHYPITATVILRKN